MALIDKEALLIQANRIRHEVDDGKNTAERVGKMFVDIIDWADESIANYGSGLTPWQKEYLESLEAEQNKSKFSIDIALSTIEKQFNGEDTQVTVYVTPKYNGNKVEASVVGTSSNLSGMTFVKGSDGRYSATVTVAAPASVSVSVLSELFTVKATYSHPSAGTISKTASATFRQNVMSMIIKNPNDYDGFFDTPLSLQAPWASRVNISGHYSMSANGKDYIYFMVPKDGNRFSSVKSSGFEVPLAEPRADVTVKRNGKDIHYWVCRTAGIPMTSPFEFDIS